MRSHAQQRQRKDSILPPAGSTRAAEKLENDLVESIAHTVLLHPVMQLAHIPSVALLTSPGHINLGHVAELARGVSSVERLSVSLRHFLLEAGDLRRCVRKVFNALGNRDSLRPS